MLIAHNFNCGFTVSHFFSPFNLRLLHLLPSAARIYPASLQDHNSKHLTHRSPCNAIRHPQFRGNGRLVVHRLVLAFQVSESCPIISPKKNLHGSDLWRAMQGPDSVAFTLYGIESFRSLQARYVRHKGQQKLGSKQSRHKQSDGLLQRFSNGEEQICSTAESVALQA